MSPKGILQWSTEVSVVVREALTEDVRRETKAVMPEEQIPPAKYPLTLEAAKRSPLVAVSSRLTSKLVEQNVRVHTIGVDRMTSSFFYIAEGGGEEAMTVSGDLVQAVAEMLGERADNAAIERVLDSLVDRLLRSLSKDRITELGVELAAALPRAASDGSGAQGVDLDTFEKDLAALVGASEKYAAPLQEIADKISQTTDRKVDVPLYGDARKVPQGPFDLTVGDRKVALGTYERWVMTGPFTEPSAAKAAPTPAPAPAAKPAPSPKPKPVEAKPAASPTPAPAKAAALAAPIAPKAASDRPPPPRPMTKSRPEMESVSVAKAEPAKVEEKKPEPKPEEPKVEAKVEEPKPEPKAEEKKPEEPKPEPKAEEKKTEAKAEEKKAEEKKPAPKAEEKKAEKKAKAEKAEKAEAAESSRELAKASDKSVEKKAAEEPAKKGGFPWLAVVVAIAIAIVVYQVFLSKK